MIIIVEGIDRVGKTTICEKIIEEFSNRGKHIIRFRDDTRYHGGHESMDINTEKINTLQSMIEEGIVDNVILDRYHLTEFVYGSCDRGYLNIDMLDIDRRLRNYELVSGTVIVLIVVEPIDVIESSKEHGSDLSVHAALFEKMYNLSQVRHRYLIDYTTANVIALKMVGLSKIEEDRKCEIVN